MSAGKMTLGQLVDILGMLWKTLFSKEVEWGSVPCETAQSIIKGDAKSFANQFVRFLANGGRVILGGLKVVTVPFDPVKFIGGGWAFWKGLKDGNGLEGEEERDKSSVALMEVDFDRAELLTCLEKGESSITGEEKLTRLKKLGRTIFGATVFAGLWQNYQSCENKAESVLEKLYEQKGITYIDFFGDVLRNLYGYRFVLYLCRRVCGQWGWYYSRLDNDWLERGFSAVSQQVPK